MAKTSGSSQLDFSRKKKRNVVGNVVIRLRSSSILRIPLLKCRVDIVSFLVRKIEVPVFFQRDHLKKRKEKRIRYFNYWSPRFC